MRATRTLPHLFRRSPCLGPSASRSCLPNWRRTYSIQPAQPLSSDDIKAEMLGRPAQWIRDILSPTNSTLLNIVLADLIPRECLAKGTNIKSISKKNELPDGHHLVYFPLQKTLLELCPDGTDPSHSPGDPFVRRMWAGGSIDFNRNFKLSSASVDCKESIEDVTFKGPSGQEKIFVTVLRDYMVSADRTVMSGRDLPRIREKRSLVFMRGLGKEQARENLVKSEGERDRIVKASNEPDYSFTLTPTPRLLFYFSALSFNSHSIHLDTEYCRKVEGHRNLLVHGPLSLILMLSAVKSQLKKEEKIVKIDYRNLAPLYANEPLRVCVRRVEEPHDGTQRDWEVWVEDRDGGLAVRGTARTDLK
ncbi:uncharacterized protein F4807DRAFT_457934 [Annulohypoxylon truncatum]|uniref:uncharacterized protein n=1 Tax=Annulohypoxylon truncatum TaxID=327061 RepID=UPI0020082DEC|nr:uncharacterized protein F4807DRAFT_457934 [Annulohypoxylon truncatum]KAI1212439.1 hypothetical protein F4807DRAFT_457934 [Annulohypoxylon truncatum]